MTRKLRRWKSRLSVFGVRRRPPSSRRSEARTVDASWPEKVGFVGCHRDGRLLVRGVFAGHYVYVDEADHISQSGAAEGGAVGRIIGVLGGPSGLAVGPTLGALAGSRSGTASEFETDPETLVAQLREVVWPRPPPSPPSPQARRSMRWLMRVQLTAIR